MLAAALVSALIAGLALKLARYGQEPKVAEQPFVAALQAFLADQGWMPTSPSGGYDRGAYAVHSFQKDGCTAPLLVIVLGPHDGLAALVRRDLGPDLAFLQNGGIREQPALWRYHLETIWRALGRATGLHRRPSAPLVAIAPAPRSESAPCGPPSPASWQALS